VKGILPNDALAACITRRASSQTYYTIRLLVDPDRIPDAFRAYAYFRWVDDQLDQPAIGLSRRIAFADRQQALLDACLRGAWPQNPSPEECMLVDLIKSDGERDSGLQAYARNMMAVMAFDARRRGRVISERELCEYARSLATAVTEALHYFIGHDCRPPRCEERYLAATGAHIVHMLRDAHEDVRVGYFNIPREFLESHGLSPQDLDRAACRTWVRNRVELAQACFAAGRGYLARVESLRCRLAGYAYMARFERLLKVIEGDGYRLRPEYPECKSLTAGIGMGWSVLAEAFATAPSRIGSRVLPAK
jgi:phytoene/squalene synthetase